MTKEEADAKVTGLKEYAKATFDAAVASVTENREPVEMPEFSFHGQPTVERLQDGSMKWTIKADDRIQEFVQAEVARLEGSNDTV